MPGSTTQRRAGDVELQNAVEILRAVDHQRGVDRLPALRRAAAARRHADALVARDRYRPIGVLDRARRHHAERHDLVVRGVGRVAAAREAVEHDVAGALRLQAAFQPRHDRFAHPHHLARGCCPYPPKALTDYRIRHSWRQVAAGARHRPRGRRSTTHAGPRNDDVQELLTPRRPPFPAHSGAVAAARPRAARDGHADHRPPRSGIRRRSPSACSRASRPSSRPPTR